MALSFLEILKVLLLGIVEGITEWLPISSTGHMLLVDEFLRLEAGEAFKELFFVVIQLGAILAVVTMFWDRMQPFARREGRLCAKPETVRLWGKVAVACIPGAAAAFLLDDWIEARFTTPVVISLALVFYGAAFLLAEHRNKNRVPRMECLDDVTWPAAFGIGLFQVLSLVPGTSRSGATILGGLLLGVSRVAAAEFTFFLAVPAMFGFSLLKLVKLGLPAAGAERVYLLLGMTVAFLVSAAVIKFLMDYIRKHDFRAFGVYRICLGGLLLVWFLLIKP